MFYMPMKYSAICYWQNQISFTKMTI
jgi:hypothetical protein